MTSQQFFLRWDNYSNHISYAFGTLRNQEDLVDVTLSCEGKKIRAHKVLLSACSTYFRDVFKDNPCQHPVIVFKNVRFDDLLAIVEFMYQGEVSVVQESLSSFLNTAELLSVQGLTEGNNGGNNNSNSGPIIDTLTIPATKTVTLKAPAPQQVQQQAQQTVTLIPASTTERRFAKKTYPNQATATTIKTVTHPITVFSPKGSVQGTKRFVATTTPVKLTTTTQNNVQPTTTTLVTMNDGLLDTNTIHLQTSTSQPQILNTNSATTTTVGGAAGGGHQVKRKRIMFDSDENISIEDVNYVKQHMEMDMPDYIEIQTSSGGGDDEKGLVTVTAEDLMSGADESDSQTHQENVIIEEAFETGHVEDDDDEDKDKEMEITYTKDDHGNGTVVLTPVSNSSNASDKQHAVKFVQAPDGSNTKWSECSFCKLVITSVNLWRHIRTQHTAQQPQVCQYCSKNFKNKYSLREHIRIAHEKLAGSAGSGGGGGKTGGAGGGNNDDSSAATETEVVLMKDEK